MDSEVKNLVVTDRFGNGNFTYTLYCVDNATNAKYRYEVFANSIEFAMQFVGAYFGTMYDFMQLKANEVEMRLGKFPTYTVILSA